MRNLKITLVASIALGLVSGTLYGFGRYAKDLKAILQITQIDISNYGILLDCGNYIGHPATGFFYDRQGPRRSCVAAAILVFFAYLSVHLGVIVAVQQRSDSEDANENDGERMVSLVLPLFRSRTVMGLSFFVVGFGSGLGYIAALGSTTKSFESMPQHANKAIGIVAAGFGLSSTFVGLTYSKFGLTSFFLLWACLVAGVNLIGAYFLKQEVSTTITREAHTANSRVALVDNEWDGNNDDNYNLDDNDEITSSQLLRQSEPSIRRESWQTIHFWVLFASFACCTGCGLFVINNVSTMVQSVGGSDTLASSLVILLSLFNCAGRILTGILIDQVWVKKITLFRVLAFVMAMTMFLSAALYKPGHAYILVGTVAVTAVVYGGTWVVLVCIVNEWFDNHEFGKTYGLIAMGPALSSMLFNTLSAKFYQQHVEPDAEYCIGASCYYGAFVFTGGASLLGFVLLTLCHSPPGGETPFQSGYHYYHSSPPSSQKCT